MRKRILKNHLLFSALLVVIFLFSASNVSAEFIRGGENAIPNQYLVTFKPNVAMNLTFGNAASDLLKVSAVTNELILRHGIGEEKVLHLYENSIEGFAVKMDEESAKALANDPRVLRVEQDGWATKADVQQNPTWGLDRVDQKSLPLSKSYTYNTKAANVHVYVMDSGLNANHSEFTGRVGNGFDAVKDGNGTKDENGHGTHCAGTILGTKYGVAKGATVHPVQILNAQGSGQWSEIAAGADWVAANHQKPAVASLSIQGGTNATAKDAINKMISAGVFTAGAAGNSNADACSQIMPSTNCMAVAASNSSDSRWISSNYGSCVDIFAPGEQVTSASHLNNSGSTTMSGTSMATPHVAGAAALYLANNTSATPAQVKQALIDAATTGKISDPKGTPNKLLYTLFGNEPVPGKMTLNVNNSGQGSVTLDPPGGSYDKGTRVTLTAKPSSGWTFDSWSGDLTGSKNPSTITMNSNKNVTATFKSDNPQPDPNSCVGNCGKEAPGGCWCDSFCESYGDCCADKKQACGF